ncbi:hypothetical protein DFH09DRAFT_1301687 [Mycena vulgaris]|nr:hypothetical protein DFH09DRAFT_1301687 [Mycena vulgaris]
MHLAAKVTLAAALPFVPPTAGVTQLLAPCPSDASLDTGYWGPVALYEILLRQHGTMPAHYITFVGLPPHPPVAFVDPLTPPNVAIVGLRQRPDIAFIGRPLQPHVAFSRPAARPRPSFDSPANHEEPACARVILRSGIRSALTASGARTTLRGVVRVSAPTARDDHIARDKNLIHLHFKLHGAWIAPVEWQFCSVKFSYAPRCGGIRRIGVIAVVDYVIIACGGRRDARDSTECCACAARGERRANPAPEDNPCTSGLLVIGGTVKRRTGSGRRPALLADKGGTKAVRPEDKGSVAC